MRILVFGDSIAQGFYDSRGGWVERIRVQYDTLLVSGKDLDPATVFNLGISSDRTADVLVRLDAEAKARNRYKDLLLVFAIGINDTIYRDEEYESTPETYRRQLDELVTKARVFTDKILFVSLLPVVDEKLQPMPWDNQGRYYSSQRIELFNDVLETFCKDSNLPVVDLFTAFSDESDLNSLFFDGLHPNDKGHELIASTVKPAFDKLLGTS